jgi:RNA polymerase-binding transcription factor DksA
MPKTNESQHIKKAEADKSDKDRKKTNGSGSGPRPAAKPQVSERIKAARTVERADKPERSERPAKSAVATAVAQVFPPEELGKWREQLLQRRAEIAGDIDALEKDAMEAEDGHTTPNHIAERGSDAELQDVSLNIAGDEKVLIWQIDRALRKIEHAAPLPFGVCEHTRQPIGKNRLQLMPWTPLSIEGATYMEDNGLTVEDLLLDD